MSLPSPYYMREILILFLEIDHIPLDIITETWLSQSNRVVIPNYNVIRKDRSSGRGGGVAIIAHRNIPYEQIPLPDLNIEYTAIKLTTPSPTIVAAVYFPPKAQLDTVALSKLTSIQPNSRFIIDDDFNAKHAAWNNFKAEDEAVFSSQRHLNQHQCEPITNPSLPIKLRRQGLQGLKYLSSLIQVKAKYSCNCYICFDSNKSSLLKNDPCALRRNTTNVNGNNKAKSVFAGSILPSLTLLLLHIDPSPTHTVREKNIDIARI
ncbi:ORF1 [Vespula squamosa]|uniref:ORF1 n=1 Tax=Vespula squamosa TaxID=30214 RepID=A0ABD2BS73_VESSQ